MPDPPDVLQNQISVYELYNAMREKQTRQASAFTAVLDRCYSRIKKHASVNRVDCVYEVPEFILGHPLYDINRCITFVVRHLHMNGFRVAYYFPRYLYISWDVAGVKKEPPPPLPELPHPPPTQAVAAIPGRNATDADVAMRSLQQQRAMPLLPLPPAGRAAPAFRSITEFKPSAKFSLG
jgi:hypothetical protein